MTEIVQKEIKMKIYKTPITDNQMQNQMREVDIQIRKLSKDSFYLGEVWIDENIYGVLELEKEYWAGKSKFDLDFLDQITIKLLDTSGKTIGIIEERLLKELMQSAVSGKLPVFTITLKGIPYMIDIEKESNKLVFPVITNKSKGIFEIFQLSKKSLRADFIVTRKLGEQMVADIDSKRGGKIDIKIFDDEIAKNRQFVNSLALFAGTIKFHDGIGEKIKQAIDALEMGALILKPPKKALELMLNPRKAKYTARKEIEEEEIKDEIRKRRRKRKLRAKKEEEEEEEIKPERKRIPKKKSEVDYIKSKKFKSLYLEDPVNKASGVTKTIAKQLEDLGIKTVEDLISVDPNDLAELLDDPKITSAKIKRWVSASHKRIKSTLEEAESHPEDDYDLLDYGF
ncbi:MAG: hypothetical protein ACFFD2_06595 [Promethearchaeota archaeon]